MRWNNPHASELEVNIWIKDMTVVVPIRRPACAAEGHQDTAFTYIIPNDFNQLGTKVPGFTGCNKFGDCVLQIYMHSVESRTYAIGIPIIIPGFDDSLPKAQDDSQIQPVTPDPGYDMEKLRVLCLPSSSPEVHIKQAIPRKARLVSDQFNHAYQDSDYSPYSGQQHEGISRNLQAACIIKSVTGNRGELGKSILTPEQARQLRVSRRRSNGLIRRYEQLANKFINGIGNRVMKTNDRFYNNTQPTANCFRCAEGGAVNPARLQTNTYIPSFAIPGHLVSNARRLMPRPLRGFVDGGNLLIYETVLRDMSHTFKQMEAQNLTYMTAMIKDTVGTMADPAEFKKINMDTGARDGGRWAATKAQEVLKERALQRAALALKEVQTELTAERLETDEDADDLPDPEAPEIADLEYPGGDGPDELCESDIMFDDQNCTDAGTYEEVWGAEIEVSVAGRNDIGAFWAVWVALAAVAVMAVL